MDNEITFAPPGANRGRTPLFLTISKTGPIERSLMSNKSNGIGIGSLLTLLFVGLKLTHQIDWSWWWVLSPLWIGAGLVVIILIIAGIIALVAYNKVGKI